MQRAASRVDVSNFFITICTPYNILDQLKIANQKYGNSDVCINWCCVDINATEPLTSVDIFSDQATCVLPFGMVEINQRGVVRPCCKFTEVLGNINDQKLIDIFHSSRMTELRKNIQIGVQDPGCKKCWQLEAVGGTSMRNHSLSKYQDLFDQQWVNNLQIRDITVSPSSLCNFKCRICYPRSSSQIAVEHLTYATSDEEKSFLRQLIKKTVRSNIDQFEQAILENKDWLDCLHVLGGEPFMLPGLASVLTKLIENSSSDRMQLEFNTNGSIYPKDLVTLFHQFNSVEILISIDDVGRRFEIERGGIWEDVEQNIKQFSALNSESITVKLVVTVNIQNLLYLDEIADFAKSVGLDIVWWHLDAPEYLRIDQVTPLVQKLVYQKYQNHPILELQKIAERVKNSTPVAGNKFLEYTDTLDIRRNQNFSDTHSQIYNAMKSTDL